MMKYGKLVRELADAATHGEDRLARLKTLYDLQQATTDAMWEEAEAAMDRFNPFTDGITAKDIGDAIGVSRSTVYNIIEKRKKREEGEDYES